MTSKCDGHYRRRRIAFIFALAGALSILGFAAVSAQDGAQLPDSARQRQSDSRDPDFQSPNTYQYSDDGRAGDGQQFGQRAGQGGGLARARRRRLEQGFDPSAAGGMPMDQETLRAARKRWRQRAQGEQGKGMGNGFSPGGFEPPIGAFAGGRGMAGREAFAGRGRFGNQMQGRRHPGAGGMSMGMLGGRKSLDLTPLNLSEEQKQRIRQIRTATRERAKDARQLLMQRQMQLRDMLFSPNASEQQIRAARKQLRAAQDELDDLNLNDLLQIRSVLTAEQRQRLPEIAPGRAGPGRGGPGGPGGPDAPAGAGGPAAIGERPGQ